MAADQWGMITTAQATAVGVDRTTLARLVDAGLLTSPARGVYVAPAATPSHVDERAAWLRLDPHRPAWQRGALDLDGGVISHRSAVKIHGLGDLPADRVEITVPRRRTTRDPAVHLRRANLIDGDITVVDGLPVTTVQRTILDLLADNVDGGHVGDILADAAARNDLDFDTLASRAGMHAGTYGIRGRDGHALVRSLLQQASATDNSRRDEMAALLRGLDSRQRRILTELAITDTNPHDRNDSSGER